MTSDQSLVCITGIRSTLRNDNYEKIKKILGKNLNKLKSKEIKKLQC